MTAVNFFSSHHPIARQPGSKDDLGPFINVVTWILLITSALAVLTRLITKRALRRRMDIDDAFVIAALVSGLDQHCIMGCFLLTLLCSDCEYRQWHLCQHPDSKWTWSQYLTIGGTTDRGLPEGMQHFEPHICVCAFFNSYCRANMSINYCTSQH